MRTFICMMLLSGGLMGCPDDPFCRKCSEEGKCELCYDSVLTEEGKCDPKIELIPHCSIYGKDPKSTVCVSCVYGYRQEKGVCVRCAESNCAICETAADNCSQCFGNVLAKDGKCSNVKMQDSNCFIPFDEEKCVLCAPGFAGTHQLLCKNGPRNCLYRADSSTCETCLDGTYLSKDFTCIGTPKPVPDFETNWVLFGLVFLVLVVIAGTVYYFFFYNKKNRGGSSYDEPEYVRTG